MQFGALDDDFDAEARRQVHELRNELREEYSQRLANIRTSNYRRKRKAVAVQPVAGHAPSALAAQALDAAAAQWGAVRKLALVPEADEEQEEAPPDVPAGAVVKEEVMEEGSSKKRQRARPRSEEQQDDKGALRQPTAQQAQVLEAISVGRQARVTTSATVHGWNLSFTAREDRDRPNPRVELRVRAPDNSKLLRSLDDVKRAMGLLPGRSFSEFEEEPATVRTSRRRVKPQAKAPMEVDEEDEGDAEEDDEEEDDDDDDDDDEEEGDDDDEDEEELPPVSAHSPADKAELARLKQTLHIKESIAHIEAARDVLRDPGCQDLRPYADKHQLWPQAGTWKALVKIIKRLDEDDLPAVAIDPSRPADEILLNNLQLLLSVATAGGGESSRSLTGYGTIAVAVEGLRDPSLHLLAALVRHGIKAFGGSSAQLTKSCIERIADTQRQIVGLGLIIDGDIARPDLLSEMIDKRKAVAVQRGARVCVADAARALAACGGSVDDAIDHVRSERAAAAASADGAAAGGVLMLMPPIDTNEPLLVPLSLRLKANGHTVAPNLVTTAAALAMCRDTALAADDACRLVGIHLESNRKTQLERVTAVRDRIVALGPLEEVLASLSSGKGGGGGGGGGGGRGGGGGEGAAPRDDEWFAALRDRLGPVVNPHWRSKAGLGYSALADIPFLRAAYELLHVPNQDIARLCVRHGVDLEVSRPAKLSHVRELRDRIKSLGAASVAPDELTHPKVAVQYDEAVLTSLQMRLTLAANLSNTCRFEDVSVALDLVNDAAAAAAEAGPAAAAEAGPAAEGGGGGGGGSGGSGGSGRLDAFTSCFRRGVEHRADRLQRIELIRKRMAALERPMEPAVTVAAVQRVRELVTRAGAGYPPICALAAGVFACACGGGASDPLGACNHVLHALGEEPIDAADVESEAEADVEAEAEAGVAGVADVAEAAAAADGGGAGGGGAAVGGAADPAQPPPISDELLRGLRRHIAAKLGRQEAHMPHDKFLRAAVDLARPATRDVNWKLLDVNRVCARHGIDLNEGQRKSKYDTIKKVRDWIKRYTPADGSFDVVLARRGLDAASPEDRVLYSNVQMLLQTTSNNSVGGHSRSASALETVAVAVQLYHDPTTDIDRAATALGSSGGAQCVTRVEKCCARLRELGLLDGSLDLTRPISRELVDELRTMVSASVADAARAVLAHGSDLAACVAELRARLGLVAQEEVVEEAEGLRLHTSDIATTTGYKNVARTGQSFEAAVTRNGERHSLGKFPTAVEAAVAFARYRLEHPRGSYAGSSEEGAEATFNDDDDDDDAEVEDGEEDDEPEPYETEKEVEARQAAHNRALEPLLGDADAPGQDASGVVALEVSAEAAAECAEFMRTHWRGGRLLLPGTAVEGRPFDGARDASTDPASLPIQVTGWSTYDKTLNGHDSEQQRKNTLLMTNPLVPACRKQLPGFARMEEELVEWLQARYGTVVELFYAHGLRQSKATLQSTGFSVHQDTEDYTFIDYTIVVKLTPDGDGAPPSAMRVVGADRHFLYGAPAGASGCFRAHLYHASVEPEADDEHLKIAYFFRKSTRGERRAKRKLTENEDLAELELAQRRKAVASSTGASPELRPGAPDGDVQAWI